MTAKQISLMQDYVLRKGIPEDKLRYYTVKELIDKYYELKIGERNEN